jgi:uncharacterized membrane protein YeaQ/YmgE (transglycosylase-associated protein family)
MGIIAWIVLGLIAGLIARAILPGDDEVGVIVTMLIGVVGAIAGGLVADAVGWEGLGSFFDLRTWLIAIAGSVVFLAILRAARRGRSFRDPLTH